MAHIDDSIEPHLSLSAAAARNLATATVTVPQWAEITPRWLHKLLRWIKRGKRHPDVGDHVTIYPNSTILGGKTHIGEHSTIGANVFLMQSVPPQSLVIYEEKQLSVLDKHSRRKLTAAEYTI